MTAAVMPNLERTFRLPRKRKKSIVPVGSKAMPDHQAMYTKVCIDPMLSKEKNHVKRHKNPQIRFKYLGIYF
jgi:hypothetical protein